MWRPAVYSEPEAGEIDPLAEHFGGRAQRVSTNQVDGLAPRHQYRAAHDLVGIWHAVPSDIAEGVCDSGIVIPGHAGERRTSGGGVMKIVRHEGHMTFQEDWNPWAPGGAATASFAHVLRPREAEFIVLNERLAEGEEHFKELVNSGLRGDVHEIRERCMRPRGPMAIPCPNGTRGDDSYSCMRSFRLDLLMRRQM